MKRAILIGGLVVALGVRFLAGAISGMYSQSEKLRACYELHDLR
jgi:hypothetical protein